MSEVKLMTSHNFFAFHDRFVGHSGNARLRSDSSSGHVSRRLWRPTSPNRHIGSNIPMIDRDALSITFVGSNLSRANWFFLLARK